MFFNYIYIDKEVIDNENGKNNLYKIRFSLIGSNEEIVQEFSDYKEFVNYLKSLQNDLCVPLEKLLEEDVLYFSDKILLKKIMKDASVSSSFDTSNLQLNVEKNDDKYNVSLINSESGDGTVVTVDSLSVKDQLIDKFRKLYDLENYSINSLYENGKIKNSVYDDKIQYLRISLEDDKIVVEENTKNAFGEYNSSFKDISELPDLFENLLFQHPECRTNLGKLFKEGLIDFSFARDYESDYNNKKIKSVSINPDLGFVFNAGLSVRSKRFTGGLKLDRDGKKIYDLISAMCDQYECKDFSALLETGKINFSSSLSLLPNEVVFGRKVDDETGEFSYNYYAVFDDHYEKITNDEVVEYFNEIAKKKNMKNMDEMFDNGYCKLLYDCDSLDYMENKFNNSDLNEKGKFSLSSIITKIKDKKKKFSLSNIKEGIFTKIKSVGKKVKEGFKKFVNDPLKKFTAITTALTCGVVGLGMSSMFRGKNNDDHKVKEDNLSNSIVDDYVSNPLDSYSDNNSLSLSQLTISNSEYNSLLEKCTTNQDRYEAMKRIGYYLQEYNDGKDSKGQLSFEEGLCMYLAYNTDTGSKFNNILGEYSLSDTLSKTLMSSVSKNASDIAKRKTTFNFSSKSVLLDNEDARSLYSKYEQLFVNMNNSVDDVSKVEYVTEFYNMVREDLPGMNSGDYSNVSNYMYLIEEFVQAIDSKNIATSNHLTEREKKYVHGILDNVIVPELEKANSSNMALFAVDGFYGNSYEDENPTIEEFMDAFNGKVEKKENKTTDDKKKKTETVKANNDVVVENNDGYNDISYNYDNYSDDYNSYDDSDYSTTDNYDYGMEDNYNYDNDLVEDDSVVVIDDNNVEIIDNNGASVVEGTLSEDDMSIMDSDINSSNDVIDEDVLDDSNSNTNDNISSNDNNFDNNDDVISDDNSNTNDDVISDDDNNSNDFSEGVISEDEIINDNDNYEDIVDAPSEDEQIYESDSPLPDPNLDLGDATNMSNEEYADFIIEQMANANYQNSDNTNTNSYKL